MLAEMNVSSLLDIVQVRSDCIQTSIERFGSFSEGLFARDVGAVAWSWRPWCGFTWRRGCRRIILNPPARSLSLSLPALRAPCLLVGASTRHESINGLETALLPTPWSGSQELTDGGNNLEQPNNGISRRHGQGDTADRSLCHHVSRRNTSSFLSHPSVNPCHPVEASSVEDRHGSCAQRLGQHQLKSCAFCSLRRVSKR